MGKNRRIERQPDLRPLWPYDSAFAGLIAGAVGAYALTELVNRVWCWLIP